MNQHSMRSGSDGGFTLVEVLVSCLLLVIGIGGALTLVNQSGASTNKAQKQDVATQVARQAIEELRGTKFSSVAVRDNLPTTLPTGLASQLSGDHSKLVAGDGLHGTQPAERTVFDSSAPHAYTQREVGTGEGKYTVRVYRFVTYRQEKCPLVNLTAPLTQLTTSITNLSSVLRGLTTRLTGIDGAVTAALTSQARYLQSVLEAQTKNTASSNATVVSGVLRTLVAGLLSTTATLVTDLNDEVFAQLVPKIVDPITGQLGAVLTPLASVLDPLLTQVVAPLQNLTDLCSVKAIGGNGLLPDLSAVTGAATPQLNAAVTASANSAQAVLTDVNKAASDLLTGDNGTKNGQLVVPSCPISVLADPCFLVSGVLTTATNTVTGLVNTLAAATTGTLPTLVRAVAAVPSLVAGLPSGLTTLLGQLKSLPTALDTAVNGRDDQTKRITVAVQVSTPDGNDFPARPLWYTTVITDPTEGLL